MDLFWENFAEKRKASVYSRKNPALIDRRVSFFNFLSKKTHSIRDQMRETAIGFFYTKYLC